MDTLTGRKKLIFILDIESSFVRFKYEFKIFILLNECSSLIF